MTKEDIYEALCDIAEDMLTTPEELLSFLAAQSEQIGQKQRETLPPEVSGYLSNAKAEKKQHRAQLKAAEEEKGLKEQIKAFKEVYPEVGAEEIPETVFADMQKGIPLVYAYAYYLAAGDGESRYAEDVNKQNARMAMPPVNEADENGELTMDEVEAMPPAAVKKNYPRVLKSIGKWRL